jgi:F0F1-type ATP synthase membrane subunit b/b'
MEEMETDTGAEETETEDPMEGLTEQLKIVAGHFQVLAGSGKSLKLKWPSAFATLSALAAYFNIDIFAIFSIPCIRRYSFYTMLQCWLLIPLAILGTIILVHRVATATGCTGKETADITTMAWQRALILLFLVYPSLCNVLLSMFKCREIEDKHWLVADLNLECYTSEWTNNAVLAIFGIIFFPLGVPIGCYLILSRNQHKLFTDPKFSERFGFLYGRYEEDYWFWEIVEMLRKFCLCGVIMFVKSGSMLQLCVSIVVGGLFLGLHFKFQPYDDDLDDNLQTSALLATFLTLVITVLIKSKESGPATMAFMMVVNFGVLATAMYAMVMDTIPGMIEEYTEQIDQVVALKDTLLAEAAAAAEARELAAAAKSKAAASVPDKVETAAAVATSSTSAAVATAAIAATATDGADKDGGKDTQSDLDKQIHRLFLRYDLDGSGTINSFDELEQLCCNLGYRLELELNPKQIDTIIGKVKEENPSIEWELQEFSTWFKATFL